ncbi:MAG: hypothetical protein KDE27_11340 [Planctomycetes bacterium]|nr:hypothetical protein [Planctomycetota bacterium]
MTTRKTTKKAGRAKADAPPPIAEKVIDLLCEGLSLSAIHKRLGKGTAPATVIDWTRRFPDFSERYTRAREARAWVLVDEACAIADGLDPKTGKPRVAVDDAAAVNRDRLRVETRKWFASRMLPQFNEKQQHELGGGITVQVITGVPK